MLGLRATECTTGAVLDQEQIQALRREDVLDSLGQIARKFRPRVGESLATVERHSVSLREATTASLEALKTYSGAMKTELSGGSSIPALRRAVDLDPEFGLAWANLALAYTGIGESVRSARSRTCNSAEHLPQQETK